jgi:hypothetical protein
MEIQAVETHDKISAINPLEVEIIGLRVKSHTILSDHIK